MNEKFNIPACPVLLQGLSVVKSYQSESLRSAGTLVKNLAIAAKLPLQVTLEIPHSMERLLQSSSHKKTTSAG